VVAVITAILTAIYMTRMMVMTFWGKERFHGEDADVHAYMEHGHDDAHAHDAHSDDDDHDDEHHAVPHDFKPHESPWVMTVPLVVLAFLSTVGGLVGVPYALSSIVGVKEANSFEHTLEPVVVKREIKTADGKVLPVKEEDHSAEVVQKERLLAAFSVVVAIIGIGIGWTIFKKNPLKKMPKILEDKWRIDELYNGYVVNPITNFSTKGLWKGFDIGVIDGIVNGIGHFVTAMGGFARQIQVGFVRSYAAVILFGALIVIGYFLYYGLKLIR
ncbi:MAG TPA: hypothetical protein PKE69_04615, partial [Pyrinomonadaceae bacterium]|nr:hypothetical protein [Pyrinomonadaceae bacterium]